MKVQTFLFWSDICQSRVRSLDRAPDDAVGGGQEPRYLRYTDNVQHAGVPGTIAERALRLLDDIRLSYLWILTEG
ncbi:uncharacterized protein PG986_004539 [Apiospora aurea]|uniref:Uncharacterized protein n=1 Tax=Apiospora aurea TaxID=335848 RepID=A0ABR1QMV6_9PEZI